MYKMTLQNKDYETTQERFFENFSELRQYYMSLVDPKVGGSLEKYCTEIYKDEFTEDWIEAYCQEHTFNYFSKENGTMMSGSIQNGMDNNDDACINYIIEAIEMTYDFGNPVAWGAESRIALEEVFPQDFTAIRAEFDLFIKEINETEDCVDAYRIGLAHSKESMEAYDKFVSCCGSTDIGKEVNGVLYMFGCNYGH